MPMLATALPSMVTSCCWTSWNFASGRPNCWRSTAYCRATSNAASCCPTPCQATMIREPRRSSLVSSKLLMPGEAVRFGHPDVGEDDVRVLHRAQGNLVLDPAPAHARQGGVDDEAADAAVGLVPGPDQHVVAKRPVADPALGAVEHPGVAAVGRAAGDPPGPGFHAAGNVRAVVRFGEGKGAGGAQVCRVLEQARLLLLGAEAVERLHEEVMVDQEEGGERGVHPGHLGDDDPGEQVAVAALGRGAELQGGQLGQDVGREFGLVPPVRGERGDLGGQELPQLRQFGPLRRAEQGFVVEEVRRGQPRHRRCCHCGAARRPALSRSFRTGHLEPVISAPCGWRRRGGSSRR